MRSALLFVLFLLTTRYAPGQTEAKMTEFVAAKQIRAALCSHDTDRALALAAGFEQQYPGSATRLAINSMCGAILAARGAYEAAIEKYRAAIDVKPGPYVLIYGCDSGSDDRYGDFRYMRAEACVTLSNIYLRLHAPSSALSYLVLADSLYHPWTSCGNGYISYRSRLSPYFADVYVALGDTNSAIRRLARFLLQSDGDKVAVARKLHEVLLYTYTQAQITSSVDLAISKLRMIERSGGYRTGELELYGHKVHYSTATRSVTDCKAALLREQCIRVLRSQ